MAEITLYDAYNKPVQKAQLTQELAAPTLTGLRTIWSDAVSMGLTPASLTAILQNAATGYGYEQLALAEEMEEKDLHYAAQLGTRKRAVVQLPVSIEPGDDQDAKSKEIAEEFNETVIKNAFFRVLLEDQMDALGKGYSVSEIMWDRGAKWNPREFKWRDPKFFQFDIVTRAEIRLRDIKDPAFGIPLEPYKFIVHYPRIKCGIPLRGGLARLVAWSFLFKNYTVKDWIQFIEIFGMPLRLGRYDLAATPEDQQKLKMAVANIASDAAAILPKNMEIEFVDAMKTAGGERLFASAAEWLDKQVSKAILGQTMTADDGSSQSQALVHDEVRNDIRDSDAIQLADTLNRDLVRPWVDLNFGPQEHYPRIVFVTAEPDDGVKKSERDGNLSKNCGIRFSPAYFEREYGFQQGDIVSVGLPAQETDAAEAASGVAVKPAPKGEAMNRETGDGANRTEQLLRDKLANVADPSVTSFVELLRRAADEANALEELADTIADAFPEMSTESLAQVIAEELLRSRMAGRIDAENG
ncbi:DUF935 domain-containing protein [Geomonas sp. Red32]|uniref:DUF935 domain-containing protein n=1 Tax=Geomonas sp. Red32 TaxID=2912856 RepID=UPI00202CD0A7|nr:DUF935 domain-containing protein [Geomonas sp. Red32]MCM0081789.1 DUF935 domain-containing protein [Geomonas sp. Red32]